MTTHGSQTQPHTDPQHCDVCGADTVHQRWSDLAQWTCTMHTQHDSLMRRIEHLEAAHHELGLQVTALRQYAADMQRGRK